MKGIVLQVLTSSQDEGLPQWSTFLALSSKAILGLKCLQGINALAYLATMKI